MGIHGLSLSTRQIVQVVPALAGAAGPSKRSFVNPTLWFLVSGAMLKKFITLVLVKC